MDIPATDLPEGNAMKTILRNLFFAALCGIVLRSVPAVAQISEPDTVFYGEVINRTSGQIDLITSGNLVWTIVRPDGQQITLSTTLKPLNNGVYSYRISVPNQAMTYGLTVDSMSIPLTPVAASCSHLSISVAGNPASIMAPGTSTFTVDQSLRASTYRLDLELFN